MKLLTRSLFFGLLTLSLVTTGAFSAAAADGRVTFTKDVLPILQEHCQACHRPNGANLGGMVAPMAFTTYKETRPWAKAIARNVESRDMPPWDATPEFHGVFRNERTLSQAEIDTLLTWVQSGASRGRSEDAPAPLEFPSGDGWVIGTPDLIVSMPEPYWVSDDVEDIYVDFATPVSEEMLSEDRYVKAVEFRPGSPVVHHIISFPLGGLAPGNDPVVNADGFSQVFRKGSNVTWQMHYHKEPGPGTGVWDQSKVGVRFYDKGFEPDHLIRMEPLAKMDFRIPAGDPNYQATTGQVFEEEVMVLSMTPHMHLRGKSARYVAYYPNGEEEILLDVPKYDFNWQTSYTYEEPKILPKGTRLEVTMAWDNSADNVYNPDPTKDVVFGKPTTAEMMFGFVNYAYVDEPERVSFEDVDLERYTGQWEIRVDGNVAASFEFGVSGGSLTLSQGSAQNIPLKMVTETRFKLDLAGFELEFVPDESGAFNKSIVKQNGQEFTATRVVEEASD